MISKANPGNIVVKDEGDKRDFNSLFDFVEQEAAEIKTFREDLTTKVDVTAAQIAQLQAELQAQQEINAQMRARMEALDAILERGDKHFVSPLGVKADRANEELWGQFGQWMTNAAKARVGVTPYPNCELWKETIRTQSQTGGSPAGQLGGLMTPVPIAAGITALVETYGLARLLLTKYPMNGIETLSVIVSEDLPSCFWETDVGDEVVTTPANLETGSTIRKVDLTLKQLRALDRFSMVIRANQPSLMSFVMTRFGMSYARAEDTAAFFSPGGGGANPFKGLLNADNVTGVTANSGTSIQAAISGTEGYDLFVDTQNAVSEFAVQNAVWIFSKSVQNHSRKLRGADSLYWAPMTNGAPDSLLGSRYYVSAVMPQTVNAGVAFMIYGDPSFHLMGIGQDLQIEVSEQSGFREFAVDMRLWERVCFANALPAAFAVGKTHA